GYLGVVKPVTPKEDVPLRGSTYRLSTGDVRKAPLQSRRAE
ncbi:hypothetical protein AVEN_240051-1, partial [Araneus ventricosus]